MPEQTLLVRLTTNRATTWFIRNVASKLDPVIFKWTNGRFTSFGPAAMPMLTLTVTGRRSGAPRSVQLAYVPDGSDCLVVASAMGQEKHPAWRYNLEANPDVDVQLRGERFKARAEVLTDNEKKALWDTILKAIPQIAVYETRTDRDIRVFRLHRASPAGGA